MPKFDTEWETLVRAQPAHASAPPEALGLLIHTAQATGLDPLQRQLYLIVRGGKWAVQTSIDGFRMVASRSALYAGQAGPFWTLGPDSPWTDIPPDGKPYAAKVGVRLVNHAEPTWGVAKYADYAAGPMWSKFPSTMVAKCAEALALRKALPGEFSGLYTAEEMDQAIPREVAPVQERRDWAAGLTRDQEERPIQPHGKPETAPSYQEAARRITVPEVKLFLAQLKELWKVDRAAAEAAHEVLKERGLV